MHIKIFIFCILNFFIANAKASYVFQYTHACENAYACLLSLRTSDGYDALKQATQENPENLLPAYIEDYDDFFLLLINGDAAELEKRKSHLSQRIALIEKGNNKDPMYRLCKAGLYMHWAVIYGRMDQNFQAATLFRKSYILLKENKKLFPDFDENNVFLGLEEAIAGTIPDGYKWLASIFGLNGNIKNGAVKLAGFLNNNPNPNSFLRAEAAIYYCYVKFYLQYQQDVAWNYLNSAQFSVQNNLLNAFVKANLALNYRRADVALQTLQYAATLHDYSRFPMLEYEMATCFYLKTNDDCINYFQQFVRNSKGSFFVKDAWQKMALSYYLQKNISKADYCKAQIIKSGNLFTDADKQAQRFAENTVWPEPILLKAHLLIDGGYYQKALDILSGVNEGSFQNIADKAEYNFRLGRVYDELEQDNKAISLYQNAINIGKERKEHFAARAALQMAFIFEKRGQKSEAIERYKECLSMRHHDFQNSIDQQAKAGLNRFDVKE